MMDASLAAKPAGVLKSTRVRYLILAMLFVITMLNCADRATLSLTGTAMRKEFGFSAVHMGYLFSAFSWAYVLAQVPAGWLLDRFGARRIYASSLFFWSLFTLLQSTIGIVGSMAGAVTMLFALRFLMGAAEAPAFPANAKVVMMWFPSSERGTAAAIFNSAQYFAAVVFTPLMGWITHSIGWHAVYLVMGVAGFLLTFAWLRVMRQPGGHPWVNQAELDHIAGRDVSADASAGAAAAPAESARLDTWFYVRQLLCNRMLLGVYLGQYGVNVVTYFFLTWFPVYLVQTRGMTILKAGLVASLPAICGFTGGVLGGMLSDALIKRGYTLTFARKVPIVGGMLLSGVIIGCNYVSSDWLIVLLMSLAFFGKGVGALGWAVISDTAPNQAVGLSGSIFNTFGNIAGIVTPIVIGYLVAGSSGSFNGALVFVGANALLTVFCYLVIVKDIHRVELRTRA